MLAQDLVSEAATGWVPGHGCFGGKHDVIFSRYFGSWSLEGLRMHGPLTSGFTGGKESSGLADLRRSVGLPLRTWLSRCLSCSRPTWAVGLEPRQAGPFSEGLGAPDRSGHSCPTRRAHTLPRHSGNAAPDTEATDVRGGCVRRQRDVVCAASMHWVILTTLGQADWAELSGPPLPGHPQTEPQQPPHM